MVMRTGRRRLTLACAHCTLDSLRYFDVVKAADLDLVNANIQANGGKVRHSCTHA